MELDSLASFLNPIDLISGAAAAKLVGRVGKAGVGLASSAGSTAVRDVSSGSASAISGIWRSLPGGGRLWVSEGPIISSRVADLVNQTRRSGREIIVLSGTHGDGLGRIGVSAEFALAMGEMSGDLGAKFLREDIVAIARNGHAPGIRVLDITRMSERELQMVLRGGADVYAAWCHSGLTRSLTRAFDRVNAVAP